MNQQRMVLVLFVLVVVVVTCTLSLNQVIAGEKAQVKEQTIKGKVVQSKSGVVVLDTTWRNYGLTGMDLSKMLGSRVKVTGTVSSGKSGKIINVVKVEKIK